jgi:small subunit ribosomal protein S17
MKAKNIGKGVKAPKKECKDNDCPFHGTLKARGRVFVGTVLAAKMHKTATIEWIRRVMIPKYERYAKKRTRIKARNPGCIKAKEGDVVKIMECRPLSKTVNFVIVEKLGKEKGFIQRMELLEEGKKKMKEKEAEEKAEAPAEEKETGPKEEEKTEPEEEEEN